MGMWRAAAVGLVLCALVGAGAWGMFRRPALHWCCIRSPESGFGVCRREELECLPSENYPTTTQDRAACFEWRAVIRDVVVDDCNPTMTSCEMSRAKIAGDPEYGDVGVCEVVDANQQRHRARSLKTTASMAGAGVLFALAVLWWRRRRPRSAEEQNWRDKLKGI